MKSILNAILTIEVAVKKKYDNRSINVPTVLFLKKFPIRKKTSVRLKAAFTIAAIKMK